jgi:hypothetical protein
MKRGPLGVQSPLDRLPSRPPAGVIKELTATPAAAPRKPECVQPVPLSGPTAATGGDRQAGAGLVRRFRWLRRVASVLLWWLSPLTGRGV